MEKRAEIDMQIMAELYKAIEALGGDSRLLALVGSYGDLARDPAILKALKEWNRTQIAATERAATATTKSPATEAAPARVSL